MTIACPTATSYTDTGLINGTTYYYVVSATYTGGPERGRRERRLERGERDAPADLDFVDGHPDWSRGRHQQRDEHSCGHRLPGRRA